MDSMDVYKNGHQFQTVDANAEALKEAIFTTFGAMVFWSAEGEQPISV